MMGKKLLALLLCGALLVTVLAACGAPEEKDVSAEQDSQPVETEKEPDTGDASLDNPRNQDGIGEKELLVVSFGTSYNDSRRLTIGAIENAMEEAFPEYAVRRGFTSQIIIDHVKSRDNVSIDNVKQALDRAVENGVKTLVIQPTHLMDGLEYTDLVDELAHTNADGSKNDKRYSDVLEVLAQGINVISTINVQHLESVAARVEEATGIAVRERIPDTVLRRADQVVNVDVTKEELRERLRQGKIYAPQQAERALSSFFTYENLSFLRELCLREASGDQVRKIEAQELLKPALAGYAVEAVMVALSSWPTDAESLIRRGVRMANQLGSPCYVVYVRRPQESPTRIDAGIQRQLQHNLQLATRLGAEVVQLEGVDIAETLVNFASERNVRHAIFGKSRLSPLRERLRGSFLLDFLYEAVGVDVHVANVTPKYIK